MNTKSLFALFVASVFGFTAGTLCAADQEKQQKQETQTIQKQDQTQEQQRQQEQEQKMIYGWQLMSVQEREEHQKTMRNFKTEEERTAYRQEHHKKMQQRAEEQGVTIPEVPAERGTGGGGGGGGGGDKVREKVAEATANINEYFTELVLTSSDSRLIFPIRLSDNLYTFLLSPPISSPFLPIVLLSGTIRLCGTTYGLTIRIPRTRNCWNEIFRYTDC